jgi:hypothetical protein
MTFVRAHDHPAMVAFAAQIEEHRGPTTISTIAPAWIDDERAQTSNSVVVVEEDSKGCDADVEAAVLEPVLTKNAGEVCMKDWLSIPAYSRHHPCGKGGTPWAESHVKFIKVGSSAKVS